MAAASWRRNFWDAVSPSFLWYLTFMKSSKKPMTPKTRANRKTNRAPNRP